MRPEDLYRLLHQNPFPPTRVHLKDGRCYDIRYPNQAVVGKTFIDIGIPLPNQPEPIFDYVESLDPADIDRVEMLATRTSPAAT
jgi:hypothetical protein